MKTLAKKIHVSVKNLPLLWKICFIVLGLVFTANTILLIFAFHSYNEYDTVLYNSASDTLYLTIDSIESELLDIEELSTTIIQDFTIQRLMPQLQHRNYDLAYRTNLDDLRQTLYSYYDKNPHLISAIIYTNDQKIYTGWDASDEAEDVLLEILQQAAQANGSPIWMSTGRGDSSVICARKILEAKDISLQDLGTLVLRVHLRNIVEEKLSNSPNMAKPPKIRIDHDEEVIYTDFEQKYNDWPQTAAGRFTIANIGDGKYFAVNTNNSQIDWNYWLFTEFDQVAGALQHLRLAAFFIFAAVAISSSVLCFVLVKRILVHFGYLVNKMRLFEEGAFDQLSINDYTDRSDEMGYLHNSFHKMTSRFRCLVQENYIKQLEIKDARLKALEQQINPHFIFNTLQTINWKAIANNQNDISEIVQALGKLLRYSLEHKDDVVTLEKEIELAKQYAVIQQMRYRNRLNVRFDIATELLEVRIPKMALQTCLENSVKHALETMAKPCYVAIRADQGDRLHLYVEDNGPGIDENILLVQTRNADPPDKQRGFGIGLRNLNNRIKLLYGDEYGISLHNTGGGTIVEMILPISTGKG